MSFQSLAEDSVGESSNLEGESKELVWFYLSAAAFGGGVLFHSFYQISLSTIMWLAMLAFVLALVGRGKRKLFLMSLAIFCFSLGLFRVEWASWSVLNPYLENRIEQEITLEGTIKREPEDGKNSTRLYVKTEYGLLLASTKLGGDWRYGDRVLVSGTLKKPEEFETDLGRIFNYPGYLLAQGVSYQISFAEVRRIEGGKGEFLTPLYDFKRSFMLNLEQLIPSPQVGLGEGLLLGVKKALGEDLENTFRQTGIIHIVVLSGYNVMVVVTFILFILGAIFGRRLSTIFGIVGIVLFALLVGLGTTVIRASIMASLLLLMGFTGRIYLAERGLFLAGVLMIIWNPYTLAFDIGFQLSFLATLGLILLNPYLSKQLTLVPNFMGIREFLVATLATQLFVLPLLLYQMGKFSVVAVIVNVMVLPMVSMAMLFTFLAGLTAFISTSLALPFAFVAHLSLTYIIVVAKWFGGLPFAAFSVPPFSFWFVPLGYIAIAGLVWQLGREQDTLQGWKIVEEAV